MKKSCIIYCRVSTPRQAQEGESLDDQEKICRAIARERGYRVVPDGRVFREPFSGRKHHRPVFDELVAYIKEHKQEVDYLLFRVIDRFTRGGSLAYETMKAELSRYGVELVDSHGIIQPAQNTLSHLGVEYEWSRFSPSEIAEIMTANYGKTEVRNILTRLIGREIELTRQGYKIGAPADGFVNHRTTVDGKKKTIQVPDPGRAPFLEAMFEMRASGRYTDPEIVEQVNAMGYRTKIRNRWDATRQRIVGKVGGNPLTVKLLQEIIPRPIYCGVVCQKWTDWEPVRAKYDGLVSIDTFNRANRGKVYVQERGDGSLRILHDYQPERAVKRRTKHNPLFPFKNVVLCPVCRKPFTGSSPRGKLGTRYPTYHCGRGHKYFGVPKTEFEGTIAGFVSSLELKPEYVDTFEEQVRGVWKQRHEEAERVEKRTNEHLAELTARRDAVMEALIAATSDTVRRELERRVDQIEADIIKAEGHVAADELSPSDLDAFLDFARSTMEHLEEIVSTEGNPQRKEAVFRLLMDGLPTLVEIANGTPETSLVLQQCSGLDGSKSGVVRHKGLSWNTLQHEIQKWLGALSIIEDIDIGMRVT